MMKLRDRRVAQGEGQKNLEGWEKQETEGTFKTRIVEYRRGSLFFFSFLFLLFNLSFKGNRFTYEIMSGLSDLQNSLYSLKQQVAKCHVHQNQWVCPNCTFLQNQNLWGWHPQPALVPNSQVILGTEGGRSGREHAEDEGVGASPGGKSIYSCPCGEPVLKFTHSVGVLFGGNLL